MSSYAKYLKALYAMQGGSQLQSQHSGAEAGQLLQAHIQSELYNKTFLNKIK